MILIWWLSYKVMVELLLREEALVLALSVSPLLSFLPPPSVSDVSSFYRSKRGLRVPSLPLFSTLSYLTCPPRAWIRIPSRERLTASRSSGYLSRGCFVESIHVGSACWRIFFWPSVSSSVWAICIDCSHRWLYLGMRHLLQCKYYGIRCMPNSIFFYMCGGSSPPI